MADFYARLTYQKKLICKMFFPPDMINKMKMDRYQTKMKLFINIGNNRTLSQKNAISIIGCQLEHHIRNQEMKDSGKRFDEIISTTIFF